MSPLEPYLDDWRLAQAVAQGRGDSLERFIERMKCVPRILAAKNSRMGSPLDDGELSDLTQDVLTILWRKLATFEGHATLETWAYQFCVRELMNAVRRKRKLPAREADRGEGEIPEPEGRPESAPLTFDDLHSSLDRLPDDEAQTVRMKHFSGLTFDEIAARVHQSPNTIKTRYYRALERLRGMLKKNYEQRGQDL